MDCARQAAAIRESWQSGTETFVLHSSGSTGAPVAYPLPRRLLAWSAQQTAVALQIQPDDRIYCCLPLNKVGGFMQVIRSEIWNTPLMVAEPQLHPMRELAEDQACSITSLTNSQLIATLDVPEEVKRLKHFRVVLVGGEAMPESTEKAAMQAGIAVWHTYGMTETASHIALRKAGTEHFKPFDGVSLRCAADDGHLIISIPGILETDLHTRDKAMLYPDGSFSINGRIDETIVSGGVKVQAEAVEKLLHNSAVLSGRNFAISSKEDKQWGSAVVLVIEGNPLSITTDNLKALIAPVIPYGFPKEIIYVESLPRTETGKIMRAALRALLKNKH